MKALLMSSLLAKALSWLDLGVHSMYVQQAGFLILVSLSNNPAHLKIFSFRGTLSRTQAGVSQRLETLLSPP